MKVKLSFQVKDIYRLLKMKNLPRGSTTTRKATPLGDPRGVPKQFSTFWRFTKHFLKSLPICLEGFRNRLKHSSQSVIYRIEVNNSVNILVLKTRPNNIEIQLNLIMGDTENPLLGHLFDLIESTTDFAFSGDEGPDVDLNELWSSLPSEPENNSHTVASDDFLYPEIQSTIDDSSVAESIPLPLHSFTLETCQHQHDQTTADAVGISTTQLQNTASTPAPSPTLSSTPTHSLSPTLSSTPTNSLSPTLSSTPTHSPSPTLSSTPTHSLSQALSPLPTLSVTPQYTITLPHPSLPQIFMQVPGTNELQLVTLSPD